MNTFDQFASEHISKYVLKNILFTPFEQQVKTLYNLNDFT